ncbi:hypothetical protein [Fodinibius sp.]|uniref:hypothetical protein n=1 Tax=Fodinibius sp. TaxID=1872440 RepID=UPI002ACE7E68|nr:hypothetical protein [Fodinibius sp.]MDZ7660661.1 hypothetical protein [Fodinibius sp.]
MKHSQLTIFLFCLLFPFLAFAQESADVKNGNDIDRIFDLIPVEQTLTELPKDLKNQFSQNPFGISASKNEQLIELFSEAYHADSLFKIAHKHFKNNFDSSYSDSVLTILNSDKIKPVLNSEANYYTVQGIRKQIVTKYELEQDEPSQKRISIVKNLIEQSSTKKSALESQSILFRSFVIGTDAISSRLNLSDSQINSIINNFKNRLQMQLEDELVNNYLVMYHGLENDRLTKYADFYTTKAGTEFKKALNESIHTAFQEASDRFISDIKSL